MVVWKRALKIGSIARRAPDLLFLSLCDDDKILHWKNNALIVDIAFYERAHVAR